MPEGDHMATKTAGRSIAQLEKENLQLKAKLEAYESMLQSALQSRGQTKTAGEIDARLSRLTKKQHAVVLASIGGLSYQEIAAIMQADESTVKLHLKAALVHLGVESRAHLISTLKEQLLLVPNEEYVAKYGVPHSWWEKPAGDLLAELRMKRSSLYKPPVIRRRKGAT
jgi:DNA-binding CsgD family transcriptional regulator